jgi:hypothetical protein
VVAGDGVDDVADVTGRRVRTEMEVGELDDPQSIERRGQVGIARLERRDARDRAGRFTTKRLTIGSGFG